MKIGEIARAAGVSTSRIRFYEKRGIIPPARRGENGYREYPADLIALLAFIEQAQALGFTLREVSQIRETAMAKLNGEASPTSCDQALAMLTDKLAAVEALIVQAQQRKARIEELIVEFRANRAREENLAA